MTRPSAFDWLSRVAMLVLAGMITLSIVGSIAAIPSGSIEGRIGIDQPQPPLPQQAAPETAPPLPKALEEERAEPGTSGTGGPGASGTAATAPPPPEEDDAERWLEAITYALLALAGLAALATLLLWRGLKERRRIADALESISLRQTG